MGFPSPSHGTPIRTGEAPQTGMPPVSLAGLLLYLLPLIGEIALARFVARRRESEARASNRERANEIGLQLQVSKESPAE